MNKPIATTAAVLAIAVGSSLAASSKCHRYTVLRDGQYQLVRSCEKPADAISSTPLPLLRGQWCGCSTGADCEEKVDGKWLIAKKTGNTMIAGTWRGKGCVEKTCVELAGTPSMPSVCEPSKEK